MPSDPPRNLSNAAPTLSAASARPLMPSLASNRIAKAPVTPRLAVQQQQQQQQQQGGSHTNLNAATTPTSYTTTPPYARATRSNNASPAPKAPGVGFPLARYGDADILVRPSPAVTGNITPRSASRRSRIGPDSTHSSPSGTPLAGTRPVSTFEGFPAVLEEQNSNSQPGLAGSSTGVRPFSVASNVPGSRPYIAGGGHHARAGSVTGLPSVSQESSSTSGAGAGAGGSSGMFFHASEATRAATVPDLRQQMPKRAATFFYANGQEEASSRTTPELPSPPLSAVGGNTNAAPAVAARPAAAKFFFANGLEEQALMPPLPTPPMRTTSPESLPGHGAAQRIPVNRSPSPTKEGSYSSYRKGTAPVARPLAYRTGTTSSAGGGSESSSAVGGATSTPRKTSISQGHGKTSSTSSLDSFTAHHGRKASLTKAPVIAGSPLVSLNTSSAPPVKPPSATSTPALGLNLSNPLSPSVHFLDPPPQPSSAPATSSSPPLRGLPLEQFPLPTSPTKASLESKDFQAEARRERKVLDLEISNNSLLAINRGLEREVRKQKAELRRFRRLSRAGHFAASSVRTGEGRGSDDEVGAGAGASGLAAEDWGFDEDEEDEDEDDYEGGSSDSSLLDESRDGTTTTTTTPGTSVTATNPDDTEHSLSEHDPASTSASASASRSAAAERKARRLSKDSKLLALDLSRHRELLLDSQRMNQALKRCMALTEALIADGRKALEYQVRVSDVKLGGRVIEHEFDEEEVRLQRSQGLLSPWRSSVGGLGMVGDPEPGWGERDGEGEQVGGGERVEAVRDGVDTGA